jgi:transcriptional regulator with XRE-family HTH domain
LKELAVLFGNKLKAQRKSVNLSQDKLALLSDIDRSYVGRIERGEVSVTLEKVYCLAKALNCDVRELLP